MAKAESGIAHRPAIAPEGLLNSQMHREYIQRLVAGRDMRVYITADNSATGVGKSMLGVLLCLMWDQTGWTPDKATNYAAEFSNLYDTVQPGSCILLDEAEKDLEARRSMSDKNKNVSHDFATKRYRQVFAVMTLPAKSMMDKRVTGKLSDYWIQCQETDDGKPKGEAKVYRLGNNEHFETEYTERVETISWPNCDYLPEYKAVEQKKRDRMEGRSENQYVHRDKLEDLKQNYWNKATKMARYHIVRAMAEHGITQTKIAEILTTAEHVEGIGQSRVSHFVNSDSFEEVYKQ